MEVLALTLNLCSIIAFLIYFLAVFAFVRHTSSRLEPEVQACPSVSVLKPIKGLEEDLEGNLLSFFKQSYQGSIEIIFSSFEADDPGITIARKVSAENPHVKTNFVVSDPSFGLNPKVANLFGALEAAQHDLIWQTDANVRVGPDYLSKVVNELYGKRGALLTSLVCGVGERSAGAALTNLHLCAYLAPAMCMALEFGNTPCVFGKSILYQKNELEGLGGLNVFRNVLAEDFLLGQLYVENGKKIIISSHYIVQNVNISCSIRDFGLRQARWLIMRAVIHKPAFALDLLVNPIAFVFLALIFSPHKAFLLPVLVTVLKLLIDNYLIFRIRGLPFKIKYQFLIPVKEMIMLMVWGYSAFARDVNWRGCEFKVGRNSVLYVGE